MKKRWSDFCQIVRLWWLWFRDKAKRRWQSFDKRILWWCLFGIVAISFITAICFAYMYPKRPQADEQGVALLREENGKLWKKIGDLEGELKALKNQPTSVSRVCPGLNIKRWVRILDSKDWTDNLTITSEQRVEFKVEVSSAETVQDVIIKVVFPSIFNSWGNLKIDGAVFPGDIVAGINLGTLQANKTKTITFDAGLSSRLTQDYGTTVSLDCVIQAWVACFNKTEVKINVKRIAPVPTPIPTPKPTLTPTPTPDPGGGDPPGGGCPPGGPGPDPP